MTTSAGRRLTADSTSTRHSEAVSFYSLTETAMRSVAAEAGHTLSPIQSHIHNTVARPRLPPRDRFRSAVRKVVAMHRLAANIGSVGREPGVDPRRAAAQLEYGHIKQRCTIEVTDYSSLRYTSRIMNNEEFSEFIKNDRREPWAKVRWINVGGIDWGVISALALAYDMHPLSLEDMIQPRRHARSKADYYPKHPFIHVLCHALVSEDTEEIPVDAVAPASSDIPRSCSTGPANTNEALDIDESRSMYNVTQRFPWKRSFPTDPVSNSTHPQPPLTRATTFDRDMKTRKNARNLKLIQELLKGQRVNVKVTPMFIFLFRDGTVVSVQHDRELRFTDPIAGRLRQQTSGLRTTADASLLVQGLLDLVVDQAMEVIEAYQSKILKLEQAVLMKPHMKHVVRLHALQEDLILHRRTLGPIKTLVYSLRRYDVDRVAALADSVDSLEKPQGYMSHKARIYLADVHDHMEHILTSLDMFSGISANLIEYTFNMSSYEMSVVMRRLTLATVIFLPLTVLAGYFGMNFNSMWTVHHGHTDIIFWIIALPMLAILLPIFLWSDLSRMKEGLEKRLAARSVKRQYKL